MGAFSRFLFVLVACSALAGALAFRAPSAQAQITQMGSFGSSGTGDAQFSSPGGVAVDRATGDVYVADSGNARIEKFDASGNFIAAWGWGVGDGASSSEVCTTSCEAGIPGSGAGQFSDPVDVAVNNNPSSSSYEDVYVADQGNDVIEKFNASGKYLSSITGPNGGSFSTIVNVAADASGKIWAYDGFSNVDEFGATGKTLQSWNTHFGEQPGFTVDASDNVYAVRCCSPTEKFTSAGKDLGEVDPSNENASALGSDLVSDYVFDAQRSFVAIYSGPATPPTKPLATFGSGILSDAAGVTDNPSTRVAYVSDSSNDDVQMFQLPAPSAPSVDSESAANVTDVDAILNAEINPNFADTTYQVQYGTSTKYGITAPAHPADVGGGLGDVLATTPIRGLKPNTIYHFRVVAKNSIHTTDGPDRTLKTYPSSVSSGLPDMRGYEMVTPAQKDQGEPYLRFQVQNALQASTNGDGFSFFSIDAFPHSKFDGSFYLSTRGKSNWTTKNLIPPQSTEESLLCAPLGPEMVAYSPNMAMGILADGFNQSFGCGRDEPRLVSGEPKGVQNLFLRDNATGTYKLMTPNPVSGPPADALYDGASTNLSHVVFDESAQLTSNAPSGDDLYESSGGKVSLVTVLPGGTPAVGQLADFPDGDAFGAVSADGSRVFFTANGDLYVRENGKSTVQLDSPASGAPGPGGGGQFLAASADGSKAFFLDDSSAGLTSDTQSGSGQNLYEWDNGTLTDITPVAQADVDGRAALTADGSHLYFIANGQLAKGAKAAQPNLYLLQAGKTTFIATLSGSDSCDWGDSCLSARTSTSGQYLAFTSTNPLTGYDNTDENSGQRDPEIFRYDAATGKLVCVSCTPSRVAPAAGGANIDGPYTPFTSSVANGAYLQHYVSDSGQVFFDTPEQLLPADTNTVKDVYEWEPDGTGSCQSAAENHGCLDMLSGGTSVDPSLFLDATPSGSDAFLATTQQLIPKDTDGAYDIYDARVDGGFPSVPPPPPCTGEDCKPPPKPPPPLPPIATVTFHGSGQVPTVKESTSAVKGSRFVLRVRVPAKGQIAAAGTDVRSVHESVVRAGAYRLTVALTDRARRALKRERELRLAFKVRYAPARGRLATVTVKLTVKA
jgi:hypothetical protein